MAVYLVAHTNGLHDFAWFVVPVVVGLIVIRTAEKRARERASEEREDEDH